VRAGAGRPSAHEYGEPFAKNRLTDLVKKYVQAPVRIRLKRSDSLR
jgi:hypothetical protein